MSKTAFLGLAATATVAVLAAMGAASPASAQDGKGAGFYVGITGGYASGEADVDGRLRRDSSKPGSPLVSEEGKSDLEGGMIGGLVGMDYSFGNGFVLGAVGDLSWMNASGNADVEPKVINPSGSDYNVDTSLNWLGTVRGRVGFEVGKALIYGTGGLAFGTVDADLHESGLGSLGRDSSTRLGWTLGAGISYMATQNVMLGIEYLYVDLGHESYDFGNAGRADVDLNMSLVRGTVGFKF